MRHRGYATNQLFFMDESFFRLTCEELERFYLTNPVTPQADIIARHGVERYRDMLELAQSFRLKALDEVELATLCRLIFARYEANLFVDPSTRTAYVDEVLRGLYEHYENDPSDYIKGFDKLTSLLEEFDKIYVAYSEIMIIIDLYCPERDVYKTYSCLTAFRRRKRIDNMLPMEKLQIG
ncbi:hypothetical protein AAVH_17798 [Aphelenchoides avenae]|nr:hypothetical protein AAVH_17798 [Aphelenchus avenae]